MGCRGDYPHTLVALLQIALYPQQSHMLNEKTQWHLSKSSS